MAEICEGILEAINQKEKSYGILVDGKWYNKWGKCELVKGTPIRFEWERKGDFRNIKNILDSTTESKPTFPKGTTKPEPILKDIDVLKDLMSELLDFVSDKCNSLSGKTTFTGEDVRALTITMYLSIIGKR